MSHTYYMLFEFHGNRSISGQDDNVLLGKSWREMIFDGPIESMKDIDDAVQFEIDRHHNNKSFGGKIISAGTLLFYSLLRVEEEKKDTSKFEINIE